MQSLPFDLEFEIINHLPFETFLAYAATCRHARATAWTVFRHRVHCLLQTFGIPYEARSQLWATLAAATGGLTGSSLLWLTEGNPDWRPTDCNFVVGADGLEKMEAFFQHLGLELTSMPSRVPRIIPYPNATALVPYNVGSHWSSTTMTTKSPTGASITITGINDSTAIQLLMECEHSLQAGLLTATSFIFLHPRDLFARRALLRSGGVVRRSLLDHGFDPRVLNNRGYGVNAIFQPFFKHGCEPSCCPGIPRRLRAGRGVLVCHWSPAKVPDFVGDQARTGFMDGQFALTWSWGLCLNYLCKYFMHPRDMVVHGQADMTPDDEPPKLNMIRRKMSAVAKAIPVFNKLYPAALFATSVDKAIVVPVPLDVHAKTFRTIDDLRLSTWITARPPGSQRIALFLGPHVAAGTVSLSSISARRIFYQDDCYLVVFLQCWDGSLRRNLLLYPPTRTVEPAIHGDLLAICFKGNTIVSPETIGLETCTTLIRRWWENHPVFDDTDDFPSSRTPA
uniref:F-box domain-containing protein n=1 Tax=Mycena chlorophos TaxID=658473 RepID=A0ABQ0L098_MYCCL|nr:predicted protein [Mycena chlorophos]